MRALVVVMLGSAVGGGARYACTWATTHGMQAPSWVATLVVNVMGSFCIALVMALGTRVSDEARLLLGTGILGGFTTYSAFNQESLRALQEGAVGRALVNVSVTVVACVAAGFAGALAGRAATG
jgi:CrcB protein